MAFCKHRLNVVDVDVVVVVVVVDASDADDSNFKSGFSRFRLKRRWRRDFESNDDATSYPKSNYCFNKYCPFGSEQSLVFGVSVQPLHQQSGIKMFPLRGKVKNSDFIHFQEAGPNCYNFFIIKKRRRPQGLYHYFPFANSFIIIY